MKKIFAIVLIVSLVLVVTGPAFAAGMPALHGSAAVQVDQPPAGGVTLPVDLEGLIKLAVIFLVTQGLKSLSILLKKDITGWASVISASLSGAVILFFNALLSVVPQAAQASVSALLIFLVTVLSAFGIHAVYKGFLAKK